MSSMSRTVRRGASGTLVSLAALAAVAVPAAYAHYTVAYHGSDMVAIGSDHRTVSTCDRENDGNLVYADVILANGNRRQVWDNYDQLCSTHIFGSDVRDFRVCEDGVSCTAWNDA